MSSTNPAPSAETPDSDLSAAPADLLTTAVDAGQAAAGETDDGRSDIQPVKPPLEAAVRVQAHVEGAADGAEEGHAETRHVGPSEGLAGAPAAQQAATRVAQQPVPSTAATGARLAELFPALFGGAPKPLKLRIQVDIQERAPGEFSKQALSAFFRRHTGATSYLVAVSRGKQRFDLDGQPAGELSDEHRQLATDELARRRANQQARRAQEDAQREQEEAGRRQRANLLRDFHVNRLTTANFCALKGIAPDQLDGLLAQARAEAQEAATRPRHPDHGRHDAGHDRRHDGPHGAPRRDARGDGPHRHGPRAEAGGEDRADRGRPQGPRGPGNGGRRGGPAGAGQGGPGGPGGRNERRGPPRG